MADTGRLLVNVITRREHMPIEGAQVDIFLKPEEQLATEEVTNEDELLQLYTDESGQTKEVELMAPPLEYSEKPGVKCPYTEYVLRIRAQGYETVIISGVEILPEVTAIQTVRMQEMTVSTPAEELIQIPEHVLYGNYPPKIPEAEIKPIDDRGEIVLSRVVIPEYIVVHDGAPADKSAKNYYVRYRDYIKNVVSSEVYATWPESTIYANALAIISFTLNRVYTEWYRNKGYNFTITSSTAYDQKWSYGRNIYKNVSYLVDSIFANYLSRPGIKQPIFTTYCDGRKVTCAGLSQWGSKYLGDENYSAIEIIRYYYGNDMYVNTADSISGVPSSWPGYDLTIGSSGAKVRQLQNQLNRIARNYPAIPKLVEDGAYGRNTAAAVRAFQRVFGLPSTGITDYPTWYAISNIYVAVARLSEPGAY